LGDKASLPNSVEAHQLIALLDASMDAIILLNSSLKVIFFNQAAEKVFGYAREEILGEPLSLLLPQRFRPMHESQIRDFGKSGVTKRHIGELGEVTGLRKDGQEIHLEISISHSEGVNADFFAANIRDISDRKLLEAAIRESEQRYRRMVQTSEEGIVVTDAAGIVLFANPKFAQLLGYDLEEVMGHSMLEFLDEESRAATALIGEQQMAGRAQQLDFKFRRKDGSTMWSISSISPIHGDGGEYNGSLGMITDITTRKIAEESLMASEAHNRALYEAAERRLAQTLSLRKIDSAITNSLDLKFTLEIVIDQVLERLDVDAADVLLYDPENRALAFGVGRGFRTAGIEKVFVPLGKSFAGRAVMERKRISVPNLQGHLSEFLSVPDFVQEEFVDFHTVPLITKGRVLGVLETFKRSSFIPDAEWLVYLEALAGQAAIAIENIQLFNDLQQANDRLIVGYNAAIEGWSRALDLRDKETEGHSQRVTELALQLARKVGMRDLDLVNMRRGALLHDIGKMGVPDAILLKPGKLTEEEWSLMKKHPDHALAMLSPTVFLKDATDIPYSHHEKWDGTGYPQGLKGDEIPLSARLFALADVYDALTSDRPYRKAWSKDAAVDFIKSESGKHFDPALVKAFLELDLP
jgi:PAS domain S-box-containing protein/putative nucleotidyltransferase with HDIG domain